MNLEHALTRPDRYLPAIVEMGQADFLAYVFLR